MDYQRSRSPTMRSKVNENSGDGTDKVYVCFLPTEVQQAQLKEIFEQCGTVKHIHIKRKEDGFTFAYIQYQDVASAQKAVEKLNRKKIGEKSISVRPANRKPGDNANKPTFGGNDGQKKFDRNRNNDKSADKRGENRQQRNGNDGQRKPMKCFKCQGEGHMSRNCPNAEGGNGGDRPSRYNQEGERKPMKCFKCQGQGHMSRNCPNAEGGDDGNRPNYRENQGGQRKPMKCFKCQGQGHMSRNCPNAEGGDDGNRPNRENQGGQRKPMKCFKCQGEGHMSRNCPNAEGENNDRYQKNNDDRRPNNDRPPRQQAPIKFEKKPQQPAEDIDY